MFTLSRTARRFKCLLPLALLALIFHAGCGRGDTARSEPLLAIRATGSFEGTLEPCGCKDGLGGFGRRLGLHEVWRAAHPNTPLLSLDSGRAFPMKGSETDVIVPATRLSLDLLGVEVVNVGEEDLEAGLSPYLSTVREGKFQTISANLVSIDGNRPVFTPYLVLTPKVGDVSTGLRVAVIGVSSPTKYEVLKGVDGDLVHWLNMDQALAEYVPKARTEADLVVVLANLGPGAARLVASRFPDVDLILATEKGDGEAAHYKYPSADVIMTGTLGKYDILLELRRDKKTSEWLVLPVITPLDGKVPESDPGIRFVASVKADLEDTAIRRAKLMKKDPTRPDYLGSAACASCHPAEMAIWKETRHAHAWEPMVSSKSTINPLCLHCHSVGFMKPNGYVVASNNVPLQGVGCESCHGPGGEHVKNPTAHPLTKGNPEACLSCHNPGQTPDFDFKEFWPKIKHGKP